MSKFTFAVTAALFALAGTAALPSTASAGMYVNPSPIPLAKPKPVRQPPKVVAPPNTRNYNRPRVYQPHSSVTVIKRKNR